MLDRGERKIIAGRMDDVAEAWKEGARNVRSQKFDEAITLVDLIQAILPILQSEGAAEIAARLFEDIED